MITPTNITTTSKPSHNILGDQLPDIITVELYRIIDSKLHIIEFSSTITCANASVYFNMPDDEFKKFSTRVRSI